MLASELIKELQERIEMYGDCKVILWDEDTKENKYHLINVTADVADEGDNLESFIELEFE
ncbi:MAG: hypothetical protein LLF98_02370 [Clostridium sp.]|uniref:hypothetical protein n=1 Tax=Clostridium sp. TaxID=1506 RepID=UPI0025C4747C|nr:hypothetical protein [Clostridium sp.]MCE5220127.1 hypothetical protein [Clostridium sp.]